MTSSRRTFTAARSAAAVATSLYAMPAFAQDTTKVGVLHALSGTR